MMTGLRRTVLWAPRAAVALVACVASCNLYEGRTLELFADVEEESAECRDARDCLRDRPLCARGACLQCLVDADCDGATPACVGNACVQCRAADDCAGNQSCNTLLSECALTCVEPSDCAGQRATLCSNELDVCVQCLGDGDCSEPGRPACERGGRCVECMADVHCPTEKPSCQLATHRCVECVDTTQCDAGRVCDTRDSRCVDCLSDVDCGQGTCDVERRRCRLPCAGMEDCDARKPICDAPTGLCIECLNDVACVDPMRPACSFDRVCVECTTDEHCSMPGRPACVAATQRCSECTRDEHCLETRHCDLESARCAPMPGEPLMPPAPAPAPGPAPAP
jgi:hypothetical protein